MVHQPPMSALVLLVIPEVLVSVQPYQLSNPCAEPEASISVNVAQAITQLAAVQLYTRYEVVDAVVDLISGVRKAETVE